MGIYITKTFTFDSAHWLKDHKGKCANIHGHTYKLEVSVSSKIKGLPPMVMDLGELKEIVKDVIDKWDHQVLNQVLEYDNPTAEYMLEILVNKIQFKLPTGVRVQKVVLWETPTSSATWERNF